MKKFWNGRLSGLGTAFLLLASSIFNKVLNLWTTFVHTRGVGGCGKRVVIYKGFSCRKPGNLFFEDDVFIDIEAKFISESENGTVVIKRGASIGRKCTIDFTGGVIIDEMAHFAEGVRLVTHDHGYDYTAKPVGKVLHIGKNAFLGMHCTILPNVSRIGDNAVIGIGSIVTKEVPANAVVAGNPAKLIKYRDDI